MRLPIGHHQPFQHHTLRLPVQGECIVGGHKAGLFVIDMPFREKAALDELAAYRNHFLFGKVHLRGKLDDGAIVTSAHDALDGLIFPEREILEMPDPKSHAERPVQTKAAIPVAVAIAPVKPYDISVDAEDGATKEIMEDIPKLPVRNPPPATIATPLAVNPAGDLNCFLSNWDEDLGTM